MNWDRLEVLPTRGYLTNALPNSSNHRDSCRKRRVSPWGARSETAANLSALRGLAPVSTLLNTEAGKAALDANYTVTGAIQMGLLRQPILLSFPDQQRQSIKDAFITGWNAAGLADGLGTRLGSAYQKQAHYNDPSHFTSISPAVASLIAYTNETTAADSNFGKYAFANGTADNKTPVSIQALAVVTSAGGVTDVFGKAYGHVAGSGGANPYGNSRPFQTEPALTQFSGEDYFGKPSSNGAHLSGPAQDLTESPSYPSGHTTYGYMEFVLLAILVPERYQQMVTRAAEYGNDRIILGAHYAMDVIGGRTLALYDVAHLLANDPAYVGQPRSRTAVIADYRAALKVAQTDLRAALASDCGDTIPACAAMDTSRFANQVANEAFVGATLTYGLPVVHPDTEGKVEEIGAVAPEAAFLLTAAFPYLTSEQAANILTSTEGPGGGFWMMGQNLGFILALISMPQPKRP